MARPWKPRIYFTPDILGKAQVRQIASSVNLDTWGVIGRLMEFWLEAQVRATPSGELEGKSLTWLDCKVGRPGFASAMVEAGWLEVTIKGIKVPDFDANISKKAVRRIENAMRMAAVREVAAGAEGTLCSGSAENVRQTPAQPEPKKPRSKKKTAQPALPIPEYDVAKFHRWFDAYPKHRQWRRQTCELIFRELAPDDATLEQMHAALERWKRSEFWTKEDGKYVPAPDNWLRDRRWEDAPESARPVQSSGRVPAEPGQYANRRPYAARKAPVAGDAAPENGGRLFEAD